MSKCNSVKCNFTEATYYQRNWDVILKKEKDYYKNDEKMY